MVGHSLGGYVTLAFADLYPDYLKGIGLFHSTAFADSDQKKETRTKAVEFLKVHGVHDLVSNMFWTLFSKKSRELLSNEIKEVIQQGLKTSKDTAIQTTLFMRNRPDRMQLLKNVTFPVLFIIGKEDQAVTLEQSLKECYLPQQSHILILDNVAHMGMLEAFNTTFIRIKTFLDTCYGIA